MWHFCKHGFRAWSDLYNFNGISLLIGYISLLQKLNRVQRPGHSQSGPFWSARGSLAYFFFSYINIIDKVPVCSSSFVLWLGDHFCCHQYNFLSFKISWMAGWLFPSSIRMYNTWEIMLLSKWILAAQRRMFFQISLFTATEYSW